jgi:hypothetical protein
MIARQYPGLNANIPNIYKEIVNNISVFSSTGNGSFIENNTFVEEASVFIRKFDIDISKIQLIPEKIPEQKIPKGTLDYLGRLDVNQIRKNLGTLLKNVP